MRDPDFCYEHQEPIPCHWCEDDATALHEAEAEAAAQRPQAERAAERSEAEGEEPGFAGRGDPRTAACDGRCTPACTWCLLAHDCPDECGGAMACPYNEVDAPRRRFR